MRTDRFLHLSTAHVTPAVAEQLDRPYVAGSSPAWRAGFTPLTREYGWMLHVPEDPTRDAAFPQCLRDCFAAARSLDVEWIMFDRDEEEVEGLAVYDWDQAAAA